MTAMVEGGPHRYPLSALAADYARAAAGVAFTAGPLLAVETASGVAYVLGGLAILFAAFGARTALRHASPMALSPEGLWIGGLRPRTLPWAELSAMTLRFYSTHRDRRHGWMNLKLKAGRRVLTIDSTIEGFPEITAAALAAARANGLTLGDRTLANLAAMGLAGPEDG